MRITPYKDMDFDELCMMVSNKADASELEYELANRVQLLVSVVEELTDGTIVYTRVEGQGGH
jgi:hypothetical protein